MPCTDGTVKEPAHDAGGGRLGATVTRWFGISPRRVQAWREVNELPDRELMRDGR